MTNNIPHPIKISTIYIYNVKLHINYTTTFLFRDAKLEIACSKNIFLPTHSVFRCHCLNLQLNRIIPHVDGMVLPLAVGNYPILLLLHLVPIAFLYLSRSRINHTFYLLEYQPCCSGRQAHSWLQGVNCGNFGWKNLHRFLYYQSLHYLCNWIQVKIFNISEIRSLFIYQALDFFFVQIQSLALWNPIQPFCIVLMGHIMDTIYSRING